MPLAQLVSVVVDVADGEDVGVGVVDVAALAGHAPAHDQVKFLSVRSRND